MKFLKDFVEKLINGPEIYPENMKCICHPADAFLFYIV